MDKKLSYNVAKGMARTVTKNEKFFSQLPSYQTFLKVLEEKGNKLLPLDVDENVNRYQWGYSSTKEFYIDASAFKF
jgi:bifunctional pyridoxal-dependent enzyme with beta-cystathionase and maltose regulon repressor activities